MSATTAYTDCTWCGLPMYGGPSMGGVDMCGWCDCGVDRKGQPLNFALVMGRGAVFGAPCSEPTCIRHRDHPGRHVAGQPISHQGTEDE